jgi:anti-anti-sigma factor
MTEIKIIKDQICVGFFEGTITHDNAEAFLEDLRRIVAAPAPLAVACFRDVKMIMSAAIRVLLYINDLTQSAGKTFYLTDLSKEVEYTLKITNLLTILNHTQSYTNLLEEFRVQPEALVPLENMSAATITRNLRNSTRRTSHRKKIKDNGEVLSDGVLAAVQTTLRKYVHGAVEFEVVKFAENFPQGQFLFSELNTALSAQYSQSELKNATRNLMMCGTLTLRGNGSYTYSVPPESRVHIRKLIENFALYSTNKQIAELLAAPESIAN